jgi:site-specific DNA recombinase
MKVVAYARCSTDDQEESVETQLDAIREYCAREGHQIVKEYTDDGVTGGLEVDKRPGSAIMMAAAREKPRTFDAIVSRSNRRLGRDNLDLMLIRKEARRLKLKLLFTTQVFEDTATGDLTWQLMGALAEYERKLTGERVVAHNRHRAKTGRWPSGKPPIGFLLDSQNDCIIRDGNHANDAIAIFQTYIDLAGNRLATARQLNALGLRTVNGLPWTSVAIRRIISNPIYLGYIRYQETITRCDDIPEVVPRNIVETARAIFESKKGKHIIHSKHTYTYIGMIICAHCGWKYYGHISKGNRYYICTGKVQGRCEHSHGISVSRLDKLFGKAVYQILSQNAEMLKRERKRKPTEAKVIDSKRAAKAAEARRTRNLYLFEHGLISAEELTERLAIIESEAIVDIPKPKLVFDVGIKKKYLDDIADKWPGLDEMMRRRLLLQIIDKVVLDTNKPATITVHSPLCDELIVVSE